MRSTMQVAPVMPMLVVLASVSCLLVGWLSDTWAVSSAAATAGLCFVAVHFIRRRSERPNEAVAAVRRSKGAGSEPRKREPVRRPVAPDQLANSGGLESGELIDQMLADDRFALLLRPQLVRYLNAAQLQRATAALDEAMALVPEGEVLLRCWGDEGEVSEEVKRSGRVVYVEGFFLDRYPVTNRQYEKFVAQGGYEQMSLWDPSVWAGILQFVDQTGCPGPRNWSDGAPPPGTEDHPVVGVCWYEAAAFARWVGKRLPTDAEWVKAASWPVGANGAIPLQRKYPWGETMDRSLANLWGSHGQDTCAVTDFSEGVSVGGVCQLVGNVWEWTSSNFGIFDPRYTKLELDAPMKSIRGGAFDTYFDNQVSCQFQSGDSPMARKRNIGFRCALGLCDLAPQALEPAQQQSQATPAGCSA